MFNFIGEHEQYFCWRKAAICISCASVVFTTAFGGTYFGKFVLNKVLVENSYIFLQFMKYNLLISLKILMFFVNMIYLVALLFYFYFVSFLSNCWKFCSFRICCKLVINRLRLSFNILDKT